VKTGMAIGLRGMKKRKKKPPHFDQHKAEAAIA